MALLSMVGCGRIEGASVQDLSNTKDAIVESETTLAENNNEYSNKNSLFYSDISSYEIFTDVNSEAALKIFTIILMILLIVTHQMSL